MVLTMFNKLIFLNYHLAFTATGSRSVAKGVEEVNGCNGSLTWEGECHMRVYDWE